VQRINQLIADHPHPPEFGLRPVKCSSSPVVDLGAIGREFVSGSARRPHTFCASPAKTRTTHRSSATLFSAGLHSPVIEIGEKDAPGGDEFAAFFGFTSNKANAGATSAPPYEISTDNRSLAALGPNRAAGSGNENKKPAVQRPVDFFGLTPSVVAP